MRAVLDTNVLISAALTPTGIPRAIILYWIADAFLLVVSAKSIQEFLDVVNRPGLRRYVHWTTSEIMETVERIRMTGVVVEPPMKATASRDPKDNYVLDVALEGEADYIVTGDGDLLVLEEYEGIAIVTPARFLAILDSTARR